MVTETLTSLKNTLDEALDRAATWLGPDEMKLVDAISILRIRLC
jgi:hypothetical protein